MECNRDEAIRAKAIAEGKLAGRDFAGAKKFALKAQTLYPGLDGLPQMLMTIDVHISAENKVSGETDWYAILGVNPSVDDETIKKQYRKLALMLHPDKNKSVGADNAFRLLSEAWSFLSDKTKRLAYNQRRSSRGFHQKVPTQSRGRTAAPSHENGFHSFPNRPAPDKKTQKNTGQVNATSVPPPSYNRSDTFWTICHRCKMHYEYLKIYLNRTLLCHNCREAFLASETTPPSNFSNSSNQNSGKSALTNQNLGQGASAGHNSIKQKNIHAGPFSGVAGVGSTEPSFASKASYVFHQVNESMKREHKETYAASGWHRGDVSGSVLEGERHSKKTRGLDDAGFQYGGKTTHQIGVGNHGTGMGSKSELGKSGSEKDRIYVHSVANNKPNSTRELMLQLEIRNILIEKARMDICNKLNEWSSEGATKAEETNNERVKESKKEKENDILKGLAKGLNENGRVKDTDKCFNSTSDDINKEDLVSMSMNVPDPDFHDFDLGRTENAFGDNQVWAAYDDDDGMPRFYAMIHKVISTKPFKMKISWLNSKSNIEFGTLDWVGSGFSKTCGGFRVGKHEMYKSLNSFSHKVNWTKGARGVIQIFPKKGDVWALYRNWSPAWNEHTSDEVIYKYDMVEVLDDYNEEQGVRVTPLIKFIGLKSVFHANVDPEKMRVIPKEEMFRFSHQVPNYLLTGHEAPNAPKGCQELDPAAIPLELFQAVTEGNKVPMMENGEKVNGPKIKVDQIIDGAIKTKQEEMVQDGEAKRETIGKPK